MNYSDFPEDRKERKREAARKWKSNNLLKRAAYQMQFKYGITWEDFISLLEKQNYSCSICNRELSLPGNSNNAVETAQVDHCHTTGKIRGLLCRTCNRALGLFRDNPDTIHNALLYIKGN